MAFSTVATVAATGATHLQRSRDYEQLRAEMEEANDFILWCKELVTDGLEGSVKSCALPVLADAVNWFQQFYRENFEGKVAVGYELIYPDWYSAKLRLGLTVVEQAVSKYTYEIAQKSKYQLQEFAKLEDEENRSEVKRTRPRTRSSMMTEAGARADKRLDGDACGRITDAFKDRIHRTGFGWDNCPTCQRTLSGGGLGSRRTAEFEPTRLSVYAKTNRDDVKLRALYEKLNARPPPPIPTLVKIQPVEEPEAVVGPEPAPVRLNPRRGFGKRLSTRSAALAPIS